MKQFNLEEYVKNPNQKVVTRTGIPVRIICTNRKSENCPIVALIQDSSDDFEDVYYYTIDGKGVIRGNDSMDIFFAPTKKEGWVNIYTDNCGVAYSGQMIHGVYEDAETDGRSLEGYLTTTKIEWEE